MFSDIHVTEMGNRMNLIDQFFILKNRLTSFLFLKFLEFSVFFCWRAPLARFASRFFDMHELLLANCTIVHEYLSCIQFWLQLLFFFLRFCCFILFVIAKSMMRFFPLLNFGFLHPVCACVFYNYLHVRLLDCLNFWHCMYISLITLFFEIVSCIIWLFFLDKLTHVCTFCFCRFSRRLFLTFLAFLTAQIACLCGHGLWHI